MKYNGGVVAYFNSRLVARFNLEENFDSSSTSLEVHDSTAFSRFHVILATAGGVTGNNVMAFELHQLLSLSMQLEFSESMIALLFSIHSLLSKEPVLLWCQVWTVSLICRLLHMVIRPTVLVHISPGQWRISKDRNSIRLPCKQCMFVPPMASLYMVV